MLTAVLACTSATVVLQFAIEFRPYGFTFMTSSLLLWAYFRKNDGFKWRLVYAFSLAALVYSHYIAVLVCLALFLADCWCGLKKRLSYHWFWPYPLAAALFMPWLIAVLLHEKNKVNSILSAPTLRSAWLDIYWNFSADPFRVCCFLVSALIILYTAVVLCKKSRKVPPSQGILLLWVPAFFILLLFFWSHLVPSLALFHRRYLCCLVPWALGASAVGLHTLFEYLIKRDGAISDRNFVSSYSALCLLLCAFFGFHCYNTVYNLMIEKNGHDILYSIPVLYSTQADWLGSQGDIYSPETAIFSYANDVPTIAWDTYYLKYKYGPETAQVYNSATILQLLNSDYSRIYVCLPWDNLPQNIQESLLEKYQLTARNEQLKIYTPLNGLRVTYTPLNGTGLECVQRVLKLKGVSEFHVVPEQEHPDGNFPTCPSPNPETREAMELGLRLCVQQHSDLFLATDPDCDRVGIAVPEENGYRLLSGNELGVLLFDYVCKIRLAQGTMPRRPVAVTTIVSTEMAGAIARKYGVELRQTLTGFKYIGEQIGQLEKAGEEDRFLFGFEESYGYLSGTHVRDKDAVNACLLVCSMVAYYKQMGQTISEVLEGLARQHAFYAERLCSVSFPGLDGLHTMRSIMQQLRTNPLPYIAGKRVIEVIDYQSGNEGLPPADVLCMRLDEGERVMIRPSGTEPKMKLYLSARQKTRPESNNRVADLETDMLSLLCRLRGETIE